MATYYAYNGTILPALPAYNTTTYPYAAIIQAAEGETIYQLFAVDKPIFAETVDGTTLYRISAGSVGCQYAANFMSLESGWVLAGADHTFAEATYTDAATIMIWSNTDITFDDGTHQFSASVPVEYTGGDSGDSGSTGDATVTVNADLQALSFLLGWIAGRHIRKVRSDVSNGYLSDSSIGFDTDTLTLTLHEADEDFSSLPYVLHNDTITLDTFNKPAPNYVVDSSLTNAYLYNGVRLPVLPDILAEYPYLCITAENDNGGATKNYINQYYLYYSDHPIYVGTTLSDSDRITILSPSGRKTYHAKNHTVWTDNLGNSEDTRTHSLLKYRYLLWSNHDIKRGETVFLAGSEPVPAST